MTYSQAIQFLYDLQLFGAKFGLENTFRLAGLIGNPQNKLRFIHVAGTNGKGSTCAMLESIYRQTGLRVGLFTSPHLVSFAERIQVNRQLISETDVTRLVAEMQEVLKSFSQEMHPTFFEVITVMAFKYFAEQNCDLVILETGLGGRLDATNIVTPLASVITNVQFDHQQWLGNTLPEIASEKAGIIKPNIPVITGTDDPPALEIIRQVAQGKNAPLTLAGRARLLPSQGAGESMTKPVATTARREPRPTDEGQDQYEISLLGEHQKVNAAVALSTINVLQSQIPVSKTAIAEGLKHVQWAGRLQVVNKNKQILVLDGAHNPAGAQTLADALKMYFPTRKPALILGSMRDKDWPAMCRILAPVAEKIFLSPTGSLRTADPHLLVDNCRQANPGAPIHVCENLSQALQRTAAEPFVTLAGSLYIVGEAMELLHLSPLAAERSLNEWMGKNKG